MGSLRRFLFYFATLILGVGGFFLILCGMLFLSGAPAGPARSSWWRVISAGMLMVGIYALLNLGRMPDYLPDWVKRYFAPIYTLFWFIAGGVIFLVSWF